MSRPKYFLDGQEQERLVIIRTTYENAVSAGDKNVYFISGRELMAEALDNGTIDNTHPNDFGFYSMAKALGNVLEKIIPRVVKYLWQNTDDEHYVATSDILTFLKENNISCDRKTLPGDIEKLCESGIDIEEVRSRENQYALRSHFFELPEIKLLIDAVDSSKFITAKKSAELVDKLSKMTSNYQSESLIRNIYTSERVKPLNEQIYYLVDNINTAINRRKKISFNYYHYNQYRKEVPNNNGKSYCFSPYYLVWNEDRYYAVGFSEKHRKITTFRVDRMKKVEILPDDAVIKPRDFYLPEYTRQVFEMYDGAQETVTLLCKNDMMNYIIDRFEEEVEIAQIDCDHFKAVAEVSVSQTFFAWVFQFNGEIKITEPESVVSKCREMLQRASS